MDIKLNERWAYINSDATKIQKIEQNNFAIFLTVCPLFIADINDYQGLSGLVASKNASNKLVLSYTAPASTTWSVIVGAGTANTELGLTAGTTNATNPESVTYHSVWQGNSTDKPKTDQMNQVIQYFQNLGYTIDRLINTTTNKTFKWVISYWQLCSSVLN